MSAEIGNNNEYIDIVNIFEKNGKYQVWQLLLVCLPAMFVSMISVNYVFVAGDINYRCRISECESADATFSPVWWPDKDIDRCSRPIINYTLLERDTICTKESFSTDEEKCSDWLYETNDTIIAKLDLACNPWKINLVGTVHAAGMMVAMSIAGWMCDRFGRKPTLIICSVGCVLGNLKIFASSYYAFIGFEFLEAAISGGAYTAEMVLMIEICSKANRVVTGVLFSYAIYFGEALLACIAMAEPYWKNLILIMCSPAILFLSYIFILKESPRWQIVNGKILDAKKILKSMSQMNNININIKELNDMDNAKLMEVFNVENRKNREGFKEVFKSTKMLIRFGVTFFCRFAINFIYYSIVVNSVSLPGNKYTNFLLMAITSFPGELLSMYLMNKVGRKLPLICGFFICGVTSVANVYVPDIYKWVKILLLLIGKLVASACYTGIVTYTMELFPTSVRGSLIGLCTLASCTGNMLAPLTPVLTTVSPIFSVLSFGCPALIASLLLTLTPETKDLPLMDTIAQIVDYNTKTEKKVVDDTRS